jgi:hypothetical protein
MILKRLHILLPVLMILAACGGDKALVSTPERPMPEWVNNRPIDAAYYIGLGSSSKLTAPLDYAQVAKKNALSDLASEISVTVKSESFLNTMEVNYNVQETFSSAINTVSDEKLEGFEVVDVYEDGKDYFILYRLSKAEHERIRQANKNAAMQVGYDYLTKARQAKDLGNLNSATDLYVHGLFETKDYWNEVNKWTDGEEQIYLDNTLFLEMKGMLDEVIFESNLDKIQLNSGNGFAQEVEITALLNGHPVSGLSIQTSFDNSKFRSTRTMKTDASGKVLIRIEEANLKNASNALEISLDLEALKPTDVDKKLLNPMVASVRKTNTVIPIRAVLPTVAFRVSEKNFGKELGTARLADPLRRELSKQGFNFSNQLSSVDYIIDIEGDTKEGGTSQGFHVAMLDMKWTLTDKQGTVIIQNSAGNIKGLQLTFEAAGLEAYKKGVSKMEKEVAESIVKSIL